MPLPNPFDFIETSLALRSFSFTADHFFDYNFRLFVGFESFSAL